METKTSTNSVLKVSIFSEDRFGVVHAVLNNLRAKSASRVIQRSKGGRGMTHWVVFTLRGWIAFLAFMNLGTAARCFLDDKFIHTKFFGIQEGEHDKYLKDSPVVERLFGFWSLINGIIFIHCAVFIQEAMILGIAACALMLYLCFFATETFVYKTIILNGATLYPFAMTGLTLLWLMVSYRYLLHIDMDDVFDENDILRRKFIFKGASKKFR